MKRFFFPLIALTLALPVFAADKAAGEAKSQSCVGCHGAKGNSLVPTFPKLAGQHAVYLESTLKEFRSGTRKNDLMSPFAAGLSDADIADIAAYYEAQK
jgi:cytochrome c553